ncbi:hypothetical protein [Streptomyces virginiae]|uniref:hypothetical protein n=1 Tax=Streptomyces virginiae TaxID=1961 RepID=UPI00352D62E2
MNTLIPQGPPTASGPSTSPPLVRGPLGMGGSLQGCVGGLASSGSPQQALDQAVALQLQDQPNDAPAEADQLLDEAL